MSFLTEAINLDANDDNIGGLGLSTGDLVQVKIAATNSKGIGIYSDINTEGQVA